ncbi:MULTISPECIES: MarR family winged helix-turn-helix transcriptional regulator [unclassified Thomasclavelia]|uniref:MarR family winged helix-turn-helix transcriptional regulator n=1 Tax=unclassified Thomasclavelia TaxID=3025756 RepID=UPI000B36FC36|nr:MULTISPECIES: MarR family winged helix-turn-helix transcriptional regulator [unclassified Thomasclavelia]OUQ08607.1 MarR family transcriptional regulator [Erysipelatoclostridium sp. An15]
MYSDPVGRRIKIINNLMKRSMDKFFGQRPDRATLMHTWILGFLQNRQDAGKDTFQKDIEAEFSINRSTTSEMLKLMCKNGMISRVPVDYDARLKKIVLTEKSLKFNQELSRKMNELDKILIKGLSESEVETFLKLCDKLIDNLNESL